MEPPPLAVVTHSSAVFSPDLVVALPFCRLGSSEKTLGAWARWTRFAGVVGNEAAFTSVLTLLGPTCVLDWPGGCLLGRDWTTGLECLTWCVVKRRSDDHLHHCFDVANEPEVN